MKRAASHLHVVGGIDLAGDDARARAVARRRAAPLLREWLLRVRHHFMAGYLLPVDNEIAKHLTNYPSSNIGRCFAGRKRIAREVGQLHPNTIDASLKRLEACGLLKSQRGGPGKTATRYFCCNGRYVFDEKAFMPLTIVTLDSHPSVNLESQRDVNKPSEHSNPIEHKPPPTPGEGDHDANAKLADAFIAEPEIVGPTLSFDELWQASNKRGAEGYALAAFKKLSRDDLDELTLRVRDGRCDWSRNIFVGAWLKERMWLSEWKPEAIFSAPRKRYVPVRPLSAEWRAERDRQVAAGNLARVKRMDDAAVAGKDITIEVWS